MDATEIAWRSMSIARTAIDRVRFRAVPPRWSRTDLMPALAPAPELAVVRRALSARAWDDAQRELSLHFGAAPARFLITGAEKASLVRRIAAEFPASAERAAARADRIVDASYDLLGYRTLSFGHPMPNWHLDPIAGRKAPNRFHADVPFLDPICGDHKVMWELNRHQHWLPLGRAYWLTGDEKYRSRVLDELRSWLDANPPLAGVNWASMLELGFRSISWLWAIHFFADARRDDSPWLVDLLIALDRQLTHIERNLSYYFSPNTHLVGEALALYVCARTLPELAASPRREAIGRRVLLDEIDRQIARDGGHAERSTHYHRYTLDFYLLALVVARLTGDEAGDGLEEAVTRLAAAARLLADDRGRLPHIGDDDGGTLFPLTGRAPDDVRDSLAIAAALTGRGDLQIGEAPEEALWMLARVPVQSPAPSLQLPKSSALPDTGYYVSRSASEHLVIDGGPHGYRNGGHAHADALSLTMSVRGLPLLIDPGTACYTVDPALRDRMRSSALHNTLTIDDRSQSLPRGPFHWAHVANARVDTWRANDAFDYFDGAHDGYAPVVHRRRVLTLHGDLVVVADLVIGTGTHAAVAHWHLDPRWRVTVQGRRVTLTRPGERLELATPGGAVDCTSADPVSGLGWYSPVYGSLEPTTTITVAQAGAAPFWLVTVFGLSPQNAVEEVDWMPLWAEAGTIAHGAAIRITRAASVDYVLFAEPHTGDPGMAASIGAHGAPAAAPSSGPRSWRVGEIETDARALFCRIGTDRPIARLAAVDASLVRTIGRRGFLLALPDRAPDLHLDFRTEPRVAGAASGARLVVGGQEQPLEYDRRTGPRT